MGRNTRFARTAAEDDQAQADAAFMFAEEENIYLPVATTTTTSATTTTTSAATAGTSSSVTGRGRKAALRITLPGSSGLCTAATTTTTTTTATTTTNDCTTGDASAAAVPSGPARRAPRATPNHPPPVLPATARDVTDVASLAKVVTLLSAVIEKAVHDGKSVTAVNKRLISCAAEEIRRAAHALTRASPAEQPTQPTQPKPTDATGLDGVKKELVACVRAEISKLKAELVGARPGRPPPDAAAAFTSRSYAQALGSESARRPAASHPAATPPAPRVSKPAIIVATTAQVTSRQQAIEAFRRSISFRESNYAPARVQPVSHNKLRVEFDTDQQRDDALLRLGDASEVTAEPARTLKPMLILKGINKSTPSSELVDIVRRQNNCTSGELALRFVRKNRNENLYSAVLVASPDVWRKLVDQGRVCVDHQRVHVERFTPFVQCFACLQFGHVRKNCDNSAPKPCACCASTAHQEPDCPVKGNRDSLKCYNCVNRNAKFNNSDPTNHKATSGFCSVLRAMRARVENRVDYGSPQSTC